MLRRKFGAAGFALVVALACSACEGTDVTRVVDAQDVVIKGHKIILHGVIAPDAAAPKCEAEKQAAGAAKARLEAIFKAARDVSFRKTGMACLQFMNCDGFVMADGVDVGEQLVAEGVLARKGADPAAAKPDWCAPKAEPPHADPAPPVDPNPPPAAAAPTEPPKPN